MAAELEDLTALKQGLGLALKTCRERAGVTQVQLGRACGYSRQTVGHAEAGRQLLTDGFWAAADRAANAQGQLLAEYTKVMKAISAHEKAQIAARRTTTESYETTGWHHVQGAAWNDDGLARLADELETGLPAQLHVLRGPDLTTLAHQWLVAEPDALDQAVEDGGRIGSTLLNRLAELVRELRRLDDQVGGGSVLDLVEPEIRFGVRLMRKGSFTPDSRVLLYRLIGELAELAGWAAYDDQKQALAQTYYRMALYAARLAGDPLMGVYTLSMLAFQAADLGQHHEALLLLDSARYGGKAVNTPGVLSMLDAWEARAHSLAGQRQGFYQALGRANDRFSNRRIEDDPDWLYWYRQPEYLAEMCRGSTLVGDHEQAISRLEGPAGVGIEQSERDRVLYHVYTAEAYCGLGELGAAARHGHQALDLMTRDILSRRASAYVTELARRLQACSENTHARELAQRIEDVRTKMQWFYQ